MSRVISAERLVGATAFSFADLQQQADETLRRARRQAHEILLESRRQARAELERARAEAESRGYAEGHARGLAAARAEALQKAQSEARQTLTQLAEALRAQLAEWRARKHHLFAATETGLVELALAVARRVCKIEARRPEVAAANVRAALDMQGRRELTLVRMNPADLETLGQCDPALHAALSGEGLQAQADETIARGGCVLESRLGSIDATLETQLDRIAQALTGGDASS